MMQFTKSMKQSIVIAGIGYLATMTIVYGILFF